MGMKEAREELIKYLPDNLAFQADGMIAVPIRVLDRVVNKHLADNPRVTTYR